MASDCLQGASLRFVGLHYETSLYELHGPQFTNRYYILSGAGTRQLMAFPEVVGFDSYQAMLPATVAALRLLFPGAGGDVDILTILRGGLNYPVEEACARNGIRVRDIHFVSCERIIENHIITGLDIKYEKIRVSKDRVLVIGDIIATGDTLRLCLSQVVDRFRRRGGSIRKIIFFTIGGTRAITLMEKMAEDIRAVFPEFEGFECFFYEGVFTVYENTGASGINVPDIDFGWKGGCISPEFRRFVLGHPYSLLEKCIIYDGGARRYQLPVHFDEVLEYWEGIRERASRIDVRALLEEKLGYAGPVEFEDWLDITHLRGLKDLGPLWADEQALLQRNIDLKELAGRRIASINKLKQEYEKD